MFVVSGKVEEGNSTQREAVHFGLWQCICSSCESDNRACLNSHAEHINLTVTMLCGDRDWCVHSVVPTLTLTDIEKGSVCCGLASLPAGPL